MQFAQLLDERVSFADMQILTNTQKLAEVQLPHQITLASFLLGWINLYLDYTSHTHTHEHSSIQNVAFHVGKQMAGILTFSDQKQTLSHEGVFCHVHPDLHCEVNHSRFRFITTMQFRTNNRYIIYPSPTIFSLPSSQTLPYSCFLLSFPPTTNLSASAPCIQVFLLLSP